MIAKSPHLTSYILPPVKTSPVQKILSTNRFNWESYYVSNGVPFCFVEGTRSVEREGVMSLSVASEIRDRFLELGVDLAEEEIQKRFQRLTVEFKVPEDEARRSVINYFLRENELERGQYYAGSSDNLVSIGDIKEEGQWVSLKVKVVQLWEASHESIRQTGLVGDGTGTIKFTMFEGHSDRRFEGDAAELEQTPDQIVLEEGRSYMIRSAVTGVWQGRYQLNFNRATTIEEIEEDIIVENPTAEFTGVIVDIQIGSGLIKRCPECNRALSKGSCNEHGRVEGVYDLRIKAVIDDGETTQDVIVNRELTEDLCGITLEEAKDMATEALDHGIVTDAIRRKILARYYTITGRKLDRYILADRIEPMKSSNDAVERLLSQVSE